MSGPGVRALTPSSLLGPHERSGGNDSAFISLAEAGPLVLRRDRRAILAALADLGVPVAKVRNRYLVRRADVERALAERMNTRKRRAPLGVVLSPGERLWS